MLIIFIIELVVIPLFTYFAYQKMKEIFVSQDKIEVMANAVKVACLFVFIYSLISLFILGYLDDSIVGLISAAILMMIMIFIIALVIVKAWIDSRK